MKKQSTAEGRRLAANKAPLRKWSLWGTYLPERQWGTVREDYSADGEAWNSFPREHAASRAYRWGEDGLLGWCDFGCLLCFSPVFWNGKDDELKERLFGLAGPEGNHGEDVKEIYHYLDATPTHSYCKAVYLYPQSEFPKNRLLAENRKRDRLQGEFELLDTGIFADSAYFDCSIEYAKADVDDILIRVTVCNRASREALLHFLPTLWFRNTWAWGDIEEAETTRPELRAVGDSMVQANSHRPGVYRMEFAEQPDQLLFTENETNSARLFGAPNTFQHTKDAFHDAVVRNRMEAVNPAQTGTKAAGWHQARIAPGGTMVWRIRLRAERHWESGWSAKDFDRIVERRAAEATEFYHSLQPVPRGGKALDLEKERIFRQACAGLLWTKQFYCLVQTEWMDGDSTQPPPPPGHVERNKDWIHLFNRDILSMPDKWEYPYYCTWDLAFHTLPLSRIDPEFAKGQLLRLLREWYLHPNGQIPAYEWNFADVNPPVHAWAAWHVYQRGATSGARPDREFLEGVYQKLLLNFTWWVNRKDPDGKNLFSGGFLGLDNIGVFDRSKPLPTGGSLKQADGTAWMAFFCLRMLRISIELARKNRVYEDMASKFFNHYVRIIHAANTLGGCGLWNEEDGFYYDMLERDDGESVPLRIRSVVGLMPLLACEIITAEDVEAMPDLAQRVRWFLKHRPLLAGHCLQLNQEHVGEERLLALTPREHLERILPLLFSETEFLSPYGIRSVSKYHQDQPYTYWVGSQAYSVDYEPGEGTTGMFGGNSNWRGPVWFPVNFLLLEALRTYDRFYGDSLQVEFPTGSGNKMRLGAAADELARRLASLFLPDTKGNRPCHGGVELFGKAGPWADRLLFHEYFHADTGRGCGASHQTGWTALVSELLDCVRS